VFLVVFLAVWGLDLFVFRFSTVLVGVVPVLVSLPIQRQPKLNQPFLELSGTQKYAQGRKNTFPTFPVQTGTQPANDSSSAPKKQPN
jgi:hypothetical protein